MQLLDPAHANGLRLVGAFNRLDLAPADWSNCGEHRLVYAKGDPPSPANPSSFINRLTLIFEARVDTRTPRSGRRAAARSRPSGTACAARRGAT